MKAFIPLLLAFCLYAFTQDATQAGASQSPKDGPSAKTSRDSSSRRKKNKTQKKSEAKDSEDQDDLNSPTFGEGVANIVISRIRDALEGHSERLMLSIFESEKMTDYPRFENQIEAFFNQYHTFRVHSRILQATTEGEKSTILCDFEMEALPRGDSPPVRKQEQLRLELERGSKGWKIVDLKPREFFS